MEVAIKIVCLVVFDVSEDYYENTANTIGWNNCNGSALMVGSGTGGGMMEESPHHRRCRGVLVML